MKVFKKINNNVVFCLDSANNELIAFGKGIGFPKIPYELEDLSLITSTYYGIDHKYIGLINELPEIAFELSEKIIGIAKNNLQYELNPNLVFTLADHIAFAIERSKDGFEIENPLYYDIRQYYEKEIKIGDYAVNLMNEEAEINLSKEESGSIALHFINAKLDKTKLYEKESNELIIYEITTIIQNYFEFDIYKEGFNYSRFVSHLQYLLKRKETKTEVNSLNLELYKTLKEQFPETFDCVELIKVYMIKEIDWIPSEEELLYLVLHVNRLRVREDCNH